MSQLVKMWENWEAPAPVDAGRLQLALDADVWRVMEQEARDRKVSVEELITSLVRLAAMKSDYNDTIHSAMGPIGLV